MVTLENSGNSEILIVHDEYSWLKNFSIMVIWCTKFISDGIFLIRGLRHCENCKLAAKNMVNSKKSYEYFWYRVYGCFNIIVSS